MTEINLSRRQQLAAIGTLLASTNLMWFGFFMLIPLLAVHITRDLGLSAAVAGLVLAVRQLTQFGLGLFVGAISDFVGHRLMLMSGMLIRAAGFMWLAFAADELTLVLAAAVSAIGGSVFDASGKAALAAVSKSYKRESIFSLATTVGNLGMSTGPLLGVALVQLNFAVVGLVSGSLYVLNFLIIWLFVPAIPAQTDQPRGVKAMFGNLGIVWRNRAFVFITCLMAGYYALYSQINITLPLESARLTNSSDMVWPLYLINSVLAITLQFVVLRFLSKYFQSVTLIGIGTAIAALGLFAVSFVGSYGWLLACVVVYALGRLITEPISAIVVAKYASDSTMASYFGFGALALGVGGVFGNLVGGWLFDYSKEIGNPALCWWFLGAIGLLVVAGCWVFYQVEPRLEERAAPASKTGGSFEATAATPDHE